MKNKLIMLLLMQVLLPASLLLAQSTITEEIDPETISSTDAFASFNYSLVRTGYLSDKSIFPDVVAGYKGTSISDTSDLESWQELYDIMYTSQIGNSLEDPDTIINRASYNINNNQVIPIGVVDINYEHLETPSETTEDLKAALTAVSNGSTQLKTDVVFAASVLKESIYNGSNVQFKLDPAFYYTNKIPGSFTIDIDFGNGQGFRRISMGETVTVSYSGTGEKNAVIKKSNPATGESLQNTFIIHVASLTKVNYTRLIPVSGEFPSGYPHNNNTDEGKYVHGEAYVYTRDPGGKIDNPIIIPEGFDAANDRNWDELYLFLRQQNMVECLADLGYDFVILNFRNGSNYIERNAFLLRNLINIVNAQKTAPNKNVILGPSMGGLVARYALAYMEKNNEAHDANLLICFDTPNKGANVPVGLQFYLRYFAKHNKKAKSRYNWIKSPASRQMLNYHITHSLEFNTGILGPDPLYTDFQNNLNALGNYPEKTRNVAFANGSGNGDLQLRNDGTGLNAGDQILRMGRAVGKANIWALPNRPSSAVLVARCVAFNKESRLKVTGTLPYDNAPGGWRGFIKEVKGKKKGMHSGTYNQSFIPCISALAVNSSDVLLDLSSVTDLLSKTPFDAVYYPGSNQEHIQVTAENKNWLINEIRPATLEVSESFLNSKGLVNIQASREIILKPGFNVPGDPGAWIHIVNFPGCNGVFAAGPVERAKDKGEKEISSAVQTNEPGMTRIYPNPANGIIYIAPAGERIIKQIKVIGLNGTVIYSSYPFNNELQQMDLRAAESGLYFIQVLTDEKIINEKIMIFN